MSFNIIGQGVSRDMQHVTMLKLNCIRWSAYHRHSVVTDERQLHSTINLRYEVIKFWKVKVKGQSRL